MSRSPESSTESGFESGASNEPDSQYEHGPDGASVATGAIPRKVARTPEEAAQGYMDAILEGDFNAAAQWVTPEQQGIVQALGLGRGPGTLPEITGRVGIGSVVATGETTASVALVGSMCRTVPSRGDQVSDPECVTNHDPRTDLPYFVVQVRRISQHDWKVHFPSPAP